MYVHIYETVDRTYKIDSETLKEFKENSKDLSTSGLLDYIMDNYYFDDFLVDEELVDLTVDSDDFHKFLEAND